MTGRVCTGRLPLMLALDLESVLVPEIWLTVAERTGIGELALTTRDVSSYDDLMARRVALCRREGLTLTRIQRVIDTIEPLPEACQFLSWARARGPVMLLSDTFYEFASSLLEKLGQPTLLCHTLDIDAEGFISGYVRRIADSKPAAVRSLRALGFRVAAVGDSFNDLTMLAEADQGILLRPPDAVAEQNRSRFFVVDTLRELRRALEGLESP